MSDEAPPGFGGASYAEGMNLTPHIARLLLTGLLPLLLVACGAADVPGEPGGGDPPGGGDAPLTSRLDAPPELMWADVDDPRFHRAQGFPDPSSGHVDEGGTFYLPLVIEKDDAHLYACNENGTDYERECEEPYLISYSKDGVASGPHPLPTMPDGFPRVLGLIGAPNGGVLLYGILYRSPAALGFAVTVDANGNATSDVLTLPNEGIAAAATREDGTILLATGLDGDLYAYTPDLERRLWSAPLGGGSAVATYLAAADDGRVYVARFIQPYAQRGTSQRELHVFDGATGARLGDPRPIPHPNPRDAIACSDDPTYATQELEAVLPLPDGTALLPGVYAESCGELSEHLVFIRYDPAGDTFTRTVVEAGPLVGRSQARLVALFGAAVLPDGTVALLPHRYSAGADLIHLDPDTLEPTWSVNPYIDLGRSGESSFDVLTVHPEHGYYVAGRFFPADTDEAFDGTAFRYLFVARYDHPDLQR